MALAFETLVESFDQFLRVERNLSPRTRKAYRYDLLRFSEFVRELNSHTGRLPVDRVTTIDIKEYLAHLQCDRNYRPTTLSRVISSVRVFFDFCVQEGHLETSPAVSVHNPKQPKKLPVYLIEGELRKLLEAPDLNTMKGVRDRAMLTTMAFCGVRLQELVGLDLLDMDFERRTLKVFGKGSKERLIPMNDEVVRRLKNWLSVREAAPLEKAVFVNRFGHRLSGRMVQKLVDHYVENAGLSKANLSPHKLRHTFATLLHVREVDLVEIQRLMGHSSITSTQIYTHTNASKLRDAVNRLSLDE